MDSSKGGNCTNSPPHLQRARSSQLMEARNPSPRSDKPKKKQSMTSKLSTAAPSSPLDVAPVGPKTPADASQTPRRKLALGLSVTLVFVAGIALLVSLLLHKGSEDNSGVVSGSSSARRLFVRTTLVNPLAPATSVSAYTLIDNTTAHGVMAIPVTSAGELIPTNELTNDPTTFPTSLAVFPSRDTVYTQHDQRSIVLGLTHALMWGECVGAASITTVVSKFAHVLTCDPVSTRSHDTTDMVYVELHVMGESASLLHDPDVDLIVATAAAEVSLWSATASVTFPDEHLSAVTRAVTPPPTSPYSVVNISDLRPDRRLSTSTGPNSGNVRRLQSDDTSAVGNGHQHILKAIVGAVSIKYCKNDVENREIPLISAGVTFDPVLGQVSWSIGNGVVHFNMRPIVDVGASFVQELSPSVGLAHVAFRFDKGDPSGDHPMKVHVDGWINIQLCHTFLGWPEPICFRDLTITVDLNAIVSSRVMVRFPFSVSSLGPDSSIVQPPRSEDIDVLVPGCHDVLEQQLDLTAFGGGLLPDTTVPSIAEAACDLVKDNVRAEIAKTTENILTDEGLFTTTADSPGKFILRHDLLDGVGHVTELLSNHLLCSSCEQGKKRILIQNVLNGHAPQLPGGDYCVPAERGQPTPPGMVKSSRYHDTEDNNPNNHHGGYIPEFNVGSNIERYFWCTTDSASASRSTDRDWPRGNYCIYRRGGTCPDDFAAGSVYHDDEDRNTNNRAYGPLPDGSYGDNTLIQHCCRNDADSSSNLLAGGHWPMETSLWTMKKGTTCPKMWGRITREGYVYWDDEDRRNNNCCTGELPNMSCGANIRMNYCGLIPCDREETISINENVAVFFLHSDPILAA